MPNSFAIKFLTGSRTQKLSYLQEQIIPLLSMNDSNVNKIIVNSDCEKVIKIGNSCYFVCITRTD